MSRDDLSGRRGLTFSQAEGLEPLPTQLRKGQITNRTRARLWEVFNQFIDNNTVFSRVSYNKYISSPLSEILKSYFVDVEGSFSDNYPKLVEDIKLHYRYNFESGPYNKIFDFIQYMLKFDVVRKKVSARVNLILEQEFSYYRVFDGDIIGPLVSETDAETIRAALERTSTVGAGGPRSHIRNAIQALNTGDFSGSVRESIGAVESLSKVLASNPKAELASALSVLEKSANIHGGMKAAFAKLYGYTSDEKGIRHALLFEGKSSVDEADALFMIGACSAFVTYLITRANDTGITVASSA